MDRDQFYARYIEAGVTTGEAPATPLEVSRRLSELTGQLREQVRRLVEDEGIMVRARHDADLAEAKAFLSSKQTSDQKRRADALIETEELEFAAVVAESNVRTRKAKIRAIETEIDVGRTYGATVRAEFKTLGYGGDGQ